MHIYNLHYFIYLIVTLTIFSTFDDKETFKIPNVHYIRVGLELHLYHLTCFLVGKNQTYIEQCEPLMLIYFL